MEEKKQKVLIEQGDRNFVVLYCMADGCRNTVSAPFHKGDDLKVAIPKLAKDFRWQEVAGLYYCTVHPREEASC